MAPARRSGESTACNAGHLVPINMTVEPANVCVLGMTGCHSRWIGHKKVAALSTGEPVAKELLQPNRCIDDKR